MYSRQNQQALVNLSLNLNHYYKSATHRTPLKRVDIGQACIAESSNKENYFYRAQIIDLVFDELIAVQSVDYGFTQCVKITKLYEAHQLYFDKPAFSLKFRASNKVIEFFKTIRFESLKNTLEDKPVFIDFISHDLENEKFYLVDDIKEFDTNNNSIKGASLEYEINDMLHEQKVRNLKYKPFYLRLNNDGVTVTSDYYKVEVLCVENVTEVS